jgi:hypothetical protein
VLAWTFLGDEAFERSFLRFDLGGFPPVIDSLAGATLRLTPWNEPPAGDNAFHISKVSASWSESAVTWLNQPSVTTPTITVPSGSAPVSASVTPIVQDWITNPSTNYGFGLRLVTEQYYRRYYFASSDNTNSGLRPGLTIDFTHPDGEPLAEYAIAPVSPGEETTFSYRIDGVSVSPTTQTATTMTIGGVEYEGELLGFETGSSCPSGVGYHDRLEVFAYVDTLTTVVLEFDRDPATYLPMKSDSIWVMARVHPEPPQGSEVVFRLAGVDSLRFRDTLLDSLVVPIVGDSASAKLWSYAYWGVADLTATYRGPEGEASDAGEIPIDADDDGIADSWEMLPENGGALNLGGNFLDQDWDEETSPGTVHDGDDFTKLDEYKGYVIGPVGDPFSGPHNRMLADTKEFFISYDDTLTSAVAFALGKISQQLDLEVVEYAGPTTQQVYLFGRYLFGGSVSHNSVRVLAETIRHDTLSGFIWDHGNPGPANGMQAGRTNGSLGISGATVRVYVEAIHNLWHVNTYPEGAIKDSLVNLLLPEPTHNAKFISYYDRDDIDGDGVPDDYVRAFDPLAHHPVHPSGKLFVKNNDAYDLLIGTKSEEVYIGLTILHELGHALGMIYDTPDLHPNSYPSPMRRGPGPGRTDVFDSNDSMLVNLKQ